MINGQLMNRYAVASARGLIESGVFLYFLLMLVVPSGYSYGSALLLIGAVVALCVCRQQSWSSRDSIVGLSLVVFGLVWIASVLWHGDSSREMDRGSRFIFAAVIAAGLLRLPPRVAFYQWGLALGGIAVGFWAVWQSGQGASRVGGYTNTIQFGNLALMIGVICFATYSLSAPTKARTLKLGLLVAGVLALLGSLLSGSRGGWVALPFFALLFGWFYLSQPSRSKHVLMVAGFGLVMAVIVAVIAGPAVHDRVDRAVSEFHDYREGERVATSVGLRLLMWGAASDLILEAPLTGWGEAGYKERVGVLVEQGVHPEVIENYGHPHNEFLNIWAKKGVFGVLSLLLLYGAPLALFGRSIGHHDRVIASLGLSGALLVTGFVVFGLTQTFFAHNSGVMGYSVMVALLWSMMRHRERTLDSQRRNARG